MTEAVPWVKWRFDKWRGDAGLRMCSLAARGLWIELIAVMHGCDPYGHLSIKGRPLSVKQIASIVGMTSEREVTALMSELEESGVYSRSPEGLIYCRRLVRDNTARAESKAFGARGGNPNLVPSSRNTVKPEDANEVKGGVNPTDNPTDNEDPKPREERRETESESKQRREAVSVGLTAHVKHDPKTNRPTVNGYFLDWTVAKVLDAAGIDNARWTGTTGPIIEWLRDGYNPDTCVAGVKRCVARPNYEIPKSLNYFLWAIKEEDAKLPPDPNRFLKCETARPRLVSG